MNRFWSKVDTSGACWEWTAGLDNKGYGQFYFYGKNIKAHRVAWILANGINPKEDILHSCDNPKCVRIDHLRLGNDTDNMRDSLERERRKTIYTNAQVSRMRELVREGWTRQMIVNEFGGNRASATMAVTGQTFSHVETPPATFKRRDKNSSKLTLEQVKEIKRRLENPYWGINKKIAAEFGLTSSEVSHIRSGFTYRDVSPDY